jgi:hypothetical protein
MPTGYTADIKDDTSFTEFALRCARAMGACIIMRDDPLDAPIPDEFVASDYHAKALDDALSRQASVAEMTLSEAAQAMEAENSKIAESRERTIRESAETRRRYERMLAMVEAWAPPTREHVNFKKFMLDQLRESINFDCHDPDDTAKWYAGFCGTPQQWLDKEREKAAQEVAYHRQHLQEELDRTASRNSWVRELRRSLKEPAA